jgi:hypothetical protein
LDWGLAHACRYTDFDDPGNGERIADEVAHGVGNGHEFIAEKLYDYEGKFDEHLTVTKIGTRGMTWNTRRSVPYPMLCSAQSLSESQRTTLNLSPMPDLTVFTESNATTCCDLVDSVYVATGGGR